MQRYGMTIPFDGVPLHAQREWIKELEDLGYTDVWSSEANGADGFTPLRARVDVGAVAAARVGHRPVVHPGPGHAGAVRGVAGRCRAGPGGVRHRHVVERDRRALERHPVRAALRAHARHGAVPARAR